MPLRGAGISRGKAFLWGAASGIVEPIAGGVTLLLASQIQPLLPYLLAFAAGAMIYVVDWKNDVTEQMRENTAMWEPLRSR